MSSPKIIAVTGHRPKKLLLCKHYNHDNLVRFACAVLERKRDSWPNLKVITGMALGWDQAVAEACIRLEIPFIAAIPFAGQEEAWSPEQQRRYHWLLARAMIREIVCNYRLNIAYHKRNEWMVNNSSLLVALWNGSKGGTGNCVEYAEGWMKDVENVWPDWLAFS